MALNNFLPFCNTDTGTNLLSQGDYAAALGRTEGNAPGIASLELVNKALRQSSAIASQIAQFVSNKLDENVVDDGVLADLQTQLVNAFDRARVVSKATSYSLVALTDELVLFSAAATATLPTAVGITGKVFIIINPTGSYNVTINTTSAQTIGGAASGSIILSTANSLLAVVSNGTNWNILQQLPTPITSGGTGAITKAAGFDALSPMTTAGDIIVGGASGTGSRVAAVAVGQALISQGTSTAPIWGRIPTLSAGTFSGFTSSGTFTTPATSSTSTIYKYRIIGGGGGGGGAFTTTSAAGGGGAGAYAEGTFTGVAASTGIAITVGTGGAGGSGVGPNTGTSGNASVIASPVSITCGGGDGGAASNAVGSAGGLGGGVSGAPGFGQSGASGQRGFTTGVGGANSYVAGGQGGGSPFGSGGVGGSTNISGPGEAAVNYGCGGGGAVATTAAGGGGANGIVIIEQLTP
jgi:hypothetical protein